jgi:putative ABC transport system substrate-binding protein
MASCFLYRRREFIALLGGAAAAWPLAARAQQSAMPVVGFLNIASPGEFARLVRGFHQGLSETGYHEGQNVLVEYRWAEGRYDRLPALATDLVHRQVAVIVATGGPASALAAKAATAKIPIVFVASDPLGVGLVTSLSRPTENVTGISSLNFEVWAKRLEIAAELVPNASEIGLLVNPQLPNAARQLQDIKTAARTLGRSLVVMEASSAPEIDSAFEMLAQRRIGVLLVAGDPFFNSRSHQLVALAARYSIPSVYEREFAAAGGLMNYGADLADSYRLAGIYTGRILSGAKPADLPVQQSTKVELIINLKTAKALGLEVPPTLLARADEVIE